VSYFIFSEQIFTVFLSLAHLTVITFEAKITDYVGGQNGDFKVYELNKGKSLVFEAKKLVSRNFITFTRKSKFHYNLRFSEGISDKDIVVKSAVKCSYFNKLKETSEFQLFSCPKSLYLVNKSKNPLKVNEMTVVNRKYLSKGPPIYINGVLVYHNGRTL